jgi:cyclopropane fatty-acyl-phospholipid synthase-like methyltransferase
MSEPHFSKSADANKDVILERLQTVLKPDARVLEIASGTGQHALHFARNLDHVEWQPSDRDLNEYRLAETLANANFKNLASPITLDVLHWPNLRPKFDAVYSANCIHVMPLENLKPYVEGAAKSLKQGGCMLLYGPFKYGGEFTTQSNADFSRFLGETYPGGGIRDFETVNQLAKDNGLTFESDTPMPANNQFLVWRKTAPESTA